MARIEHLGIHGFRRLRSLDMPLRPMMVLIGANGVGKTSLLDAVSLISASAAGKLNQTLSDMGGLSNILTIDRAEALSFHIRMAVPEQNPLEYEVSLTPQGNAYQISRESLTQQTAEYEQPFKHIESKNNDIRYFAIEQDRPTRPDWEHNPHETSLSQVEKMFRQPEELRKILATTTKYHTLDVGPRAPVKLPQRLQPANLPGEHGEYLVSFLYGLREEDKTAYEAIIDTLKSAFPGFQELNFPPAAAGMLAMTWKESQFTRPIYAHELSEGTLRFLWLAALLQSPALSTITMIDEPEVSLHPEMLGILADLMRETAQRTQLIVATHSDSLVRNLKPEEVATVDLDDEGCARATWGDTLDLAHWLAEYSLDEVWRMGRMGGRP